VFIAVATGEGGFRRPFVIKRLRSWLTANPAAVAQFTNEAKQAAALMHPAIAPVFEFGRIGDHYFLAEDYIVGRDLGRLVRRWREAHGTALPAPAVVRVALETLKALDYAHGRRGDGGKPLGIVHRDVSPANIMVALGGEVKLVDFGVVKVTDRRPGGGAVGGAVTGNLSFMSPEQARGREVDARADLYSLGLVLFFALTGEPLYRYSGAADLLVTAGRGPGPDERTRIASLPAPFDRLVGKALAPALEDRYQTAAAFAADLAPQLGAGAALLEAAMAELFDEELEEERERLAAATGEPAGPDGPEGENTTVSSEV
jgi:serine/threonine-protein kinase